MYASIYRVFEGSGITQIGDIVRSRDTIAEHIVNRKAVSQESSNDY